MELIARIARIYIWLIVVGGFGALYKNDSYAKSVYEHEFFREWTKTNRIEILMMWYGDHDLELIFKNSDKKLNCIKEEKKLDFLLNRIFNKEIGNVLIKNGYRKVNEIDQIYSIPTGGRWQKKHDGNKIIENNSINVSVIMYTKKIDNENCAIISMAKYRKYVDGNLVYGFNDMENAVLIKFRNNDDKKIVDEFTLAQHTIFKKFLFYK